MKITTMAHGSFPTINDLKREVPRIAFVNSDEKSSFLKAELVDENLLIIAADDIDVFAIPAWQRGFLVLPATLSYRVKKYIWSSSKKEGFPSAPMAIGDAEAILGFIENLKASGAQTLTISCEYGKSRSVTAARYIQNAIFGAPAHSDLVPNAWVAYILGVAHLKQQRATYA